MRLLKTERFQVLRASSGNEGFDDGNGNWIDADQTTNQFFTDGSIQPVSSQDIRLLPDAFKSTAVYKIFTPTKLRSVNQFGATQADSIIIDDETYQVQIVERWRQLRQMHYKVFVGRTEKT